MHLAGQPKPAASGPAARASERGYAMAVLLVAMSVMAIMMTVAMPVWKQMSQREKEAELVFRGQQYARAIELMQRKMPGALPPNIDLLVTQKFLRKKYKDPITGEDFDTVLPAQAVALTPGSQQPGQPVTGRGGATGATGAGRSNTPPTPPTPPTTLGATRPGGVAGGAQGGIIGVVSKSKDTSIRLYNGRSHYNEWIFQAVQRTPTPGAGATGSGTPGRGGGPGQPTPGGRGGRGQPPGGGRGGPGMPPPGGRGPAFPSPPVRP
jgi:type II secretory pathway pseudopilin PulG